MRTLCTLILLAMLFACGGNPPRAPVEDRTAEQVNADVALPTTYTVSRGDTLYAIAWRYGFDFRKLAQANSIPSPYKIFPGQTLQLREEQLREEQLREEQLREDSSRVAAAPDKANANKGKAAQAPPVSRPPSASSGKQPASSNKTVTNAAYTGSTVNTGQWRWPTRGKIVRGFSGTVHKGVDIDGKAGDPIMVVATGKVVYAGSGIVGYGKLLIIKHNEIYLSAYGHNQRLLVEEGEVVAAGQMIAAKGSSGSNSVKLHFEIRREGKPIDPVAVLPPRKSGI